MNGVARKLAATLAAAAGHGRGLPLRLVELRQGSYQLVGFLAFERGLDLGDQLGLRRGD